MPPRFICTKQCDSPNYSTAQGLFSLSEKLSNRYNPYRRPFHRPLLWDPLPKESDRESIPNTSVPYRVVHKSFPKRGPQAAQASLERLQGVPARLTPLLTALDCLQHVPILKNCLGPGGLFRQGSERLRGPSSLLADWPRYGQDPVAQLDRARPCEGRGRTFESSRGRFSISDETWMAVGKILAAVRRGLQSCR
jgi:hypothetical protein